MRVLARLRSIPDYVPVESDAQVLIDYDNGAAGIFWTSFAMVGKSCCMKVRIYGDKGGMEWNAHDFMELRVDIAGQPTQIWSANYDYCDPQAREVLPPPQGDAGGLPLPVRQLLPGLLFPSAVPEGGQR